MLLFQVTQPNGDKSEAEQGDVETACGRVRLTGLWIRWENATKCTVDSGRKMDPTVWFTQTLHPPALI